VVGTVLHDQHSLQYRFQSSCFSYHVVLQVDTSTWKNVLHPSSGLKELGPSRHFCHCGCMAKVGAAGLRPFPRSPNQN
jgi:hypothetical protein